MRSSVLNCQLLKRIWTSMKSKLTLLPVSGLTANSTTNTVRDDVNVDTNNTFITTPTRTERMASSRPGTVIG